MAGSSELLLYHLVRVSWNDAVSHDGWDTLEQASALRPHPCVTVGICVHHDDECLVVAGSYGHEGNHEASGAEFSGVMCIPSGMIVSVEQMSLKAVLDE